MKASDSREVAFMGRVTAGFTHEMKNVLAIIKESGGLMEDLLSLVQEGSFPQKERFLRVLGKIREQVQRGVDLSTRLNRFAHSPDAPLATVDLNDTASQVAMLAERFARLKGIVLIGDPGSDRLDLVTSPVGLYMALFSGMESCWNQMKSGSELKLLGEKRGNEVAVRMVPQGDFGDPGEFAAGISQSEKWVVFLEIVASLGGRVEWSGDRTGFAVVFPCGEGLARS
jgi:hypothetical protein